jgi:uncharacterized protein YijF (DUF1287 family)
MNMRPSFYLLSVLLSCFLFLPAPAQNESPGTPSLAERLVEGARLSLEHAPRYDRSYVRLAYPGGDPGWERGACTDLVVRAFRHADVDLQRLVHEDISRAPEIYGISSPDANIDHRRTRNLKKLFERRARALPKETSKETLSAWRPGDVVIWNLTPAARPGVPNHTGIVSDRLSEDGVPLVIHHNCKRHGGTDYPAEEDCLSKWPILGHYRWENQPPVSSGQ